MNKTKEDRIAMRFIPSGYTVYKECSNGIVYASPNKLSAISFIGTSSKPNWYYQFMTVEKMDAAVTRFLEKCDAILKWNDEKKADRAKFKTELKVGDILNTSWGYDQTNVEFYQVLSVKGNTITIQEICGTYEATGYMAGRTSPIPNKPAKVNTWIEDVNGPNGHTCIQIDAPILTKRVSLGDHVKINESASAWLWKGESCYTSSYA